MAPTYTFMTGANRYRLQANTIEEALEIAFRELRPTEETKSVIRHTIYEEGTARQFIADPAKANFDPNQDDGPTDVN